MHLVLDANEYIFAFGYPRKPSCEELFDRIAGAPERYTIGICRPTIEEISRHLLPRH